MKVLAAVGVHEAAQFVGTAGVTQFAQGLGFDLADAFAGDVELLADFLQRMVRIHFDAEAHTQHLGFARGERVENFLGDPAQAGEHRCISWRQRGGIFDEVTKV